MKIAIIGGNRFTGKRLVEKLMDLNEDVLFNRSASGRPNVVRFDRDTDNINLNSFDCIVDMCLYNLKQFKLIRESIPKKARYIFVSSGAVKYKNTFGSYAVEKESIENELRNTDLNYTIVRPSYIVGYGNHIKRLEYFIDRLVGGESIKVDNGDCILNLVDVGDVAECLKLMVLSTNDLKGKIYEIGNDTETTVNEIIDIIKKELNIKKHIIQESIEDVFPNQPFKIDNKDVKKEFGIKFKDINYIIKSFIDNGKLKY